VNFRDQTGGLRMKGALHGKVGGAFTSTATQIGNQETTLFSIITNLLALSKQGVILLGIAMTIYLTLFLTQPLHSLHATFAGVAAGK
jgi:hypothetical protein